MRFIDIKRVCGNCFSFYDEDIEECEHCTAKTHELEEGSGFVVKYLTDEIKIDFKIKREDEEVLD